AREGSGAVQFRAIPPNPAVEPPGADLADLVFPPRADDQPMAVWAEGGGADRIQQGPRSLTALEIPDLTSAAPPHGPLASHRPSGLMAIALAPGCSPRKRTSPVSRSSTTAWPCGRLVTARVRPSTARLR